MNKIILGLMLLSLSACAVKTGALYESSSLPKIGKGNGQIVVYSLPEEGDTTPVFFNLDLNGKDVCRFESYTYASFNVPSGRNLLKVSSDSMKDVTLMPGQRKYIRVMLNLPKYNSMTRGQSFGLIGAGIAYLASPNKDESDYFLTELTEDSARHEVAKTKNLIECKDN